MIKLRRNNLEFKLKSSTRKGVCDGRRTVIMEIDRERIIQYIEICP